MLYWQQNELFWDWIKSSNYLNAKYFLCYELTPLEEVISVMVVLWARFGVLTGNWILIGYKSRSFPIFWNFMLISGIPTQIPESDVIISWIEHEIACNFSTF